MIETIHVFGVNISLYFLFWFLGMAASMIIAIFLGKKMGFDPLRSATYVAFDVILGFLCMWITSLIFGGGKLNGFNYVRVLYWAPIYLWPLSRLLKDSVWKVYDLIATISPILFGVGHLGCIFEGCCHGYPSDWGLYSNEAETICFPIQIIEAGISLAIAIVLITMVARNKQSGRLFGWYFLIYGCARFFCEFLRDNNKVWFNVSELAFHALATMIVGIIFLTLDITKNRNKNHETNK